MSNRKLDALYAERVLEWDLTEDGLIRIVRERGEKIYDVPNFTKSLDAAWPGVEKIISDRKAEFSLSSEHFYKDANWAAMFSWPGRDEIADVYTVHPALALVKACLLAVGVTQEEIDDAE